MKNVVKIINKKCIFVNKFTFYQKYMMLFKKTILFVSLFLLLSSTSNGQGTTKDNTISQFPIIGISLGYTFPKGDMGKNFSPYVQAGGNFLFKTNKNWVFGAEGNFISGNDNLKDDARREILKGLYNSQGFVPGSGEIQNNINQFNLDAGVTAHNRGFNILLKGGKIFPINKSNPNSGIFLMGGAGITQSKIIYKATAGEIPQLIGDYARGYDRKNRGFQLTEFVGYWHMVNSSRYLNFYIGVEFGQSWSNSLREYQFDLKAKDTKTYFDNTYTLKAGWMIPLGSKKTNEFYFN